MKKGWANVRLSEIVTLHYGKALSKDERDPNGEFPVYGANGIMDRSGRFLTTGPSLVIGRKGSAGEITRADGAFWPSDVTYFTEHDSSQVDFDFLHYRLLALALPTMARGVKPGINRNDVYALTISLPPLEEQQRIVAILDEAFEGLSRARANAEANLQNARELFESYLHAQFLEGSTGNQSRQIGDLLTLQRGFDITKKDQRDGDFPVVSSGGIKSFHSEPKARGPGVVVGRKGSIGSVYFVEADYWPHDTTLWVKDFKGNEPRLIYYLLKGLKLAELDTGAANPSLNRNLVHPITVSWPDSDQADAANRISNIEASCEQISERYRNKLQDVAHLRQSLLQKAFAGKLT